MKRRHSASDEEWARIEPLLPPPKKTGRPRKDTRELVDAVLWIFKTVADKGYDSADFVRGEGYSSESVRIPRNPLRIPNG